MSSVREISPRLRVLRSSFPDGKPAALVRMQKQHWDPLHAWLKESYGVTLKMADGFAPAKQSKETVEKLQAAIEQMNIWELAGELFRHTEPRIPVVLNRSV